MFYSSTFGQDDIAADPATSGQSEPVLVYAGRVAKSKGMPDLVEVASLLAADGLRFRLRIAGDGPFRRELEEEFRARGLGDRLELLGFVRDPEALRQCYRTSDLFVFPSLYEGAPKVIREAMAAGLPIVSTAVGDVPIVMTESQEGLVVPVGDPQAFYRAVKRLIDHPDERRAMGRRNLVKARQFTREHERETFRVNLTRAGLL